MTVSYEGSTREGVESAAPVAVTVFLVPRIPFGSKSRRRQSVQAGVELSPLTRHRRRRRLTLRCCSCAADQEDEQKDERSK